MPPRFRPATPADRGALLPMIREFYVIDGYPFSEDEVGEVLGALLADPALGRVWIAEDEVGAAAGYLVLVLGYSLEFRGRDAFVDELYVREAYRGHGLGSAALDLAEEACREMGVRALHLEVERENTGAQALYRRRGFRDHDRYLMTRWVGEPPRGE